MKMDLVEEFGVRRAAITIIPFGINNAVPNTSLSSGEARRRLGIPEDKKAILFFGNIAPYKGLEYLVRSFQNHLGGRDDYRLIIAGKPKNCEEYWKGIQEAIGNDIPKGQVLLKSDYIADEEIEIYFKAADVLVLPYRHIYQSGVLFLGYSFGLPALASDVGSLKEEIVEGRTGLIFRPEDPADLARAIETYFTSELYRGLATRRLAIIDYARERYSWDTVGRITTGVYAKLSIQP
jgi:glycosyltransferase involved in cell wall biosynthesis